MIHEYIFEEAPFDTCHASTLVKLPGDRILASWFAGSEEGKDDVLIWLAERFDGKWTTPRKVVKARNDPYWNPVLFFDGKRVFLFFKVGKGS